MTMSKNPNTYIDIEQVLAAARDSGGAVYLLPSSAAATLWRRRAYQYRTLLMKAASAGQHPGFYATTKWDDMHLRVEGAEVVITFGTVGKGTLRALDGKDLAPKGTARVDTGQDPLLTDALELLKRNAE